MRRILWIVKLVSLNVGMPTEIEVDGRTVLAGIFKQPVPSRVPMRTLHLEGDGQADLRAHGGPFKAVYAYPSEHYRFWTRELPGTELPWGAFGENLTVTGCMEDAVYIGDRFRIGSAEVVVTQPRMPCYKLGIRLGRPDIVDRFLASGRSGFYCAVAREGDVGAGDEIEVVVRDPHRVSVADIAGLFTLVDVPYDPAELRARLRRAVEVPALAEGLRRRLKGRLAEFGWDA
ncbi:MAG TPA: MOSC domain-containing protein [bacterium]|nr:MOSC domain-containing protein [bacterium]